MAGTLNPFDLFVLIVLVLFTFWGGVRGVVSQITSILSWIASAYIATHYYQVVAKFMDASYSYRTPLAMIVTFIISALLIRIASNFVKNLVSLAGLKEFDRQMGALLGMAKGFLLCLLVTFVLVVVNDSTRSVIENSNTGPYFTSFLSKIQKHLPDSELIDKFMARANSIEEEKQEELEKDGTETKSLATEVRDLKKYLMTRVLSEQATDILAEAEETREEDSASTSIGSLLQNAASSMNRLKDAFSQNPVSPGSKPSGSNVASSATSTVPGNSGSRPTYDQGFFDDYDDDFYDDYNVGNEIWSTSTNSGQRPTYGTVVNNGNYGVAETSVSHEAAPAQSSESGDFLGELSSFLSSIGGGFGGYVDGSGSVANSSNYRNSGGDSAGIYDEERTSGNYYQPSSRSGASRGVSSNASSSRLNSRTYTIEPSTVNY